MAEIPDPHAGRSNSGRVLAGFAAMSASSFAVMGVQLGYAAVTSRLLPPSAFGAYAVALSGVGIVGIVGGSSLGQSAARREHESPHLDRSLISLTLMVGFSAAIFAVLLAPLWARLWAVEESTQVTRVLAMGIPLTALSAVLAGILRRRGRTSTVAARTALGQLSGMAAGLVTVLALRTTWSLGVAAVVGTIVTTALLAAAVPAERLRPAVPGAASTEDLVYGAKAAGMNLLRYSTNLIPVWAISRSVGASDLGAYNRATTILTLPMESLQRSFSYTLFPEFRPSGPVSVRPRVLTDIMILLTWPTVFLAGVGYFAAEPLLLILLGPNWEAAGSVAGLALLLGVIPMLSVPLSNALEARGVFWIGALNWLFGLVLLSVGAVVTMTTQSMRPAMLGLLAAALCSLVLYAGVLAWRGDVRLGHWWQASWPIILVQLVVTALVIGSARILTLGPLAALMALAAVAAAELVLMWLVRERTEFWSVGRGRGLPGFTSMKRQQSNSP
jgi:O-antigen/teichoic acid export membrane protein